MALLIHPDGKQEFITLQSDDPGGRQQELTALFAGNKARTSSDLLVEPTSMAYRLKFVQVVFMSEGMGKELNRAAGRFGKISEDYRGTIAFLREEEKING